MAFVPSHHSHNNPAPFGAELSWWEQAKTKVGKASGYTNYMASEEATALKDRTVAAQTAAYEVVYYKLGDTLYGVNTGKKTATKLLVKGAKPKSATADYAAVWAKVGTMNAVSEADAQQQMAKAGINLAARTKKPDPKAAKPDKAPKAKTPKAASVAAYVPAEPAAAVPATEEAKAGEEKLTDKPWFWPAVAVSGVVVLGLGYWAFSSSSPSPAAA
jgi:hypothetical protein